MKQPCQGHINGLPHFRGLAVATNGIHVALQTSSDNLLLGHLEWMVKDDSEPTDLFTALPPRRVVSLVGMEELFV